MGDLIVFAGLGLDLRVVGLNDNVRLTFERSMVVGGYPGCGGGELI